MFESENRMMKSGRERFRANEDFRARENDEKKRRHATIRDARRRSTELKGW